ncbi:signal peptidase II [Halarcobacter ebronensis]|uniref:Lipoprotein signal peptidase n=1 Tax=Halarcobacter ebronensis TaxID=1462615 RepID=A0A4Q0YD95_9BACT|nr:signal peptidase II [Halarcobacter ebronensis]RXJ67975.1 signal peptidase II [Halarcobacter ebronensis]
MIDKFKITCSIFIALLIVDQVIKFGFAHFGWGVQGPIISLQLAYNYGVAFSMFSFLAEYLKYIQLTLVIIGSFYLYKNQYLFKEYYLAIALLYAGGLSNILDRFTYGAVVDYVYWHYMFEFAIFNLADVLIDLAVVLIIYKQFKNSKKSQ